MKYVIMPLFVCALISISSCGLVSKNNAKITELHHQIELVNKDLSELNKSYADLNANMIAARDKVKRVEDLALVKKEDERKALVNNQIAYMQKLQNDIQQVQEKISEKQERMAMLSTQVAKLE